MREDPTPKRPDEGGGFHFNGWQAIVLLLLAAMLSMMFFGFFHSQSRISSAREIPYNQFLQMVDDGEVKSRRHRQPQHPDLHGRNGGQSSRGGVLHGTNG